LAHNITPFILSKLLTRPQRDTRLTCSEGEGEKLDQKKKKLRCPEKLKIRTGIASRGCLIKAGGGEN